MLIILWLNLNFLVGLSILSVTLKFQKSLLSLFWPFMCENKARRILNFQSCPSYGSDKASVKVK